MLYKTTLKTALRALDNYKYQIGKPFDREAELELAKVKNAIHHIAREIHQMDVRRHEKKREVDND